VSPRKALISALTLFIGCGLLAAVAATPGSDDARLTATKGMSSTFISCRKSASDIALASDACMSRELKVQDARLNRNYKVLLGMLKSDAKNALVDAERARLQSASKDEAFESRLYGNSQAENAQQLENKLAQLCARANVLDSYLVLAQS
jgi:uncharacterized protein YecT (DUF1311 family)